ncbi:unnamed protein product [Angiostrongylus costaricensis]|uniref:Secreted protein n=1 Tax=Angiostrongylus costaricensis TaxID=334426 RepID=A0A0R3PT16_ANGCS|nr:unnamed protein product [Angiostrongylus costaricensis]
MNGWQVTEILIGCLLSALFLALVLVVVQCLASCFDNWRSNRLKADPERLPDDYVNEIKQLLDRHKTIMNECDFLNDHVDEKTVTTGDNLQDCRFSQMAFGVCSSDKIVDGSRRRSWSGLNDSLFDPVQLPLSLDPSVQTT